MIVDTEAAMRFLRTAYEPDDWIALFLKSYDSGKTVQRVGPLSLFLEPRVHAWLRAMNAQRFNVYVSVNAIRPGVRARTKDAQCEKARERKIVRKQGGRFVRTMATSVRLMAADAHAVRETN